LQVARLTDENEALQNSTVFLENEVADLQDQADVLNRTNMAVEATNAVLETQVDNLNAEILSSRRDKQSLNESELSIEYYCGNTERRERRAQGAN
jgi:cell division protein FtsB